MTDMPDDAHIRNALNALKSVNPYERLAAIETLARHGVASAVGPLIAATDDPHFSVREAALWALGDLIAEEALSTFANILDEADVETSLRCAALYGVGMVGTADKVPGILHIYETTADAEVKGAALRALLRMGEKSVWELADILDSREEEPPQRRVMAAALLGQVRHEAALPALIDAAASDLGPIRWAAVGALGEIASPQTTDFLLNLLELSPELGRIIVWALEQIGTPEARRTARYWRKDNGYPLGRGQQLPPDPPELPPGGIG